MTITPVAPIPSVPSVPYPFVPPPFTDIAPLTYRDGTTYLEYLKGLNGWIQNVLIPFIDEYLEELGDNYVEVANNLINTVNTALTTQENNVNTALTTQENNVNTALTEQQAAVTQQLADNLTAVNNAVQEVINSSITVQDPVVEGILTDESSQSRVALNGIFEAIDNLDNDMAIHIGAAGSSSETSLAAFVAGNVSDPASATTTALQGLYAGVNEPKAKFSTADAVVYVSTSGNDANDGKSPGNAFLTIQAAINAISVSGGVVNIAAGTYGLTQSIAITGLTNIAIRGAGANVTSIVVNGNYDAFTISGVCNRIQITNLWIGSFAVRSAGYGVNVQGTSGIHSNQMIFRDLVIQNTYGAMEFKYVDSVDMNNIRYTQSIAGAQGASSIYSFISSVTFTMYAVLAISTVGVMVGNGLVFSSDCDTIVASKCLVTYAAVGIILENTASGGVTGPRLVRMTDCYVESCTSAGFQILDGRDVRLKGCHSAVNTAIGFALLGGHSIKLMDCVALQNGTHGYYLSTANLVDCRLIGCDAGNNSANTSGASDGCYIDANVTHVRVIGCRFGDVIFSPSTQRYGMTITASTDYLIITSNDLIGNVTGTINNLSTGTHNAVANNIS